MVLPLFCSSSTATVSIDTPEYRDQLPHTVACPHCAKISEPGYFRDKYSCVFCYCLPCPMGSSNPYIGCRYCRSKLTGSKTETCPDCQTGTAVRTSYCPNCGKQQ